MKAALADATLSSRLLGAVLAFELSKDMVTSGMWMLQAETMMGRISRLSSAPETFAYLWMTLALLVVPYLVLQVTSYGQCNARNIVRLACWAILCSGVFWIYFSYLSKNLDYRWTTIISLAHGVTCIVMAGILAYGLNATHPDKQCNGVAA